VTSMGLSDPIPLADAEKCWLSSSERCKVVAAVSRNPFRPTSLPN
jgi:hypothetical protein